MPSSYTTNIAIEKPAKGEKDQTWGAVVNRNMDILDRLTSQIGSIALTGTSYTLSVSSVGLVTEGHYSMVKFTGSPGGTCTVTVSPNSVQRIYTFINSSDQTVTIAQGSGSTVDIASGAAKLVYCDGAGTGAAVVDVSALLNPADISAGDVSISGTLTLGGTDVTSTAAELNLLDGVTWTPTDLNSLTATATELNLLDGVTYTLTDLNSLTATVTELNYVDGVTSDIQTQLDGKQTIDATLTAYAGTLTAANKIPYATAADTAGELDFVDEDDMASDSATAVPSQQSVKAYVDASSPIVEIARTSISNQAEAEFTEFDSAEYVSYEFEFINVVPASDGAVLRAQTSADGGTTYDSGASDYAYAMRQNFSSGTESSTNSSGSDSMRFHKDGVGSDTGETGLSGIVRMFGPGSATETFVSADLAFTTTLGNMIGGSVQCRRNASAAVDAIKFFFNTGNLESGTIIMRGIRG